mmetsp:Transcript_2155/g.4504  ORF Transcript_2155/g.4504 Transcript_2155/m.4504 type:complete len:303 (+) Transcript_2155:328-1236(+)
MRAAAQASCALLDPTHRFPHEDEQDWQIVRAANLVRSQHVHQAGVWRRLPTARISVHRVGARYLCDRQCVRVHRPHDWNRVPSLLVPLQRGHRHRHSVLLPADPHADGGAGGPGRQVPGGTRAAAGGVAAHRTARRRAARAEAAGRAARQGNHQHARSRLPVLQAGGGHLRAWRRSGLLRGIHGRADDHQHSGGGGCEQARRDAQLFPPSLIRLAEPARTASCALHHGGALLAADRGVRDALRIAAGRTANRGGSGSALLLHAAGVHQAELFYPQGAWRPVKTARHRTFLRHEGRGPRCCKG